MRLSITTPHRRGPSPLISAALLLAVACSGDAAETSGASAQTTPAPPPALRVATTSNIVGDWVRQVGGDRVEVFDLLPVGGDPHAFQPGAQDVARVADADLVVSVGLRMEAAWLDELVGNAAADESRLVALGQVADPIRFADAVDHQDVGLPDPHFWFDPLRVKLAVSEIAARLAAIDPGAADAYSDNARAYGLQLDELHAWIQERVSALPEDRRLLVTSHDTLQYFGRLYGFDIVGAVIPAAATEREPSAAELARLVDRIRERDAPAVFVETTVSDRLARAIALETGAAVVRELYTGSLGKPDSGAATYIDMMRANVTRVVEALK